MTKLVFRSAPAVESALLAGGFLVVFFALPHALAGDDHRRFDDIEQLLHHGQLTDSRYSLVMPLFSAPLLLLGEVVRTPEWWASRFNVVVVAVGSLAAYRIVRGRVDAGVVRKLVLVLLFASYLTNRLRDYGVEVLTGTLVTLGILLLVTGRRALLAWALIVVGVVNTPAAIVGLLLVVAAETVRTRRLRQLLPLVAAALLIMGEAWLRRGGPLVTGYEGDHGVRTVLPYSGQPGFSYPFPLGLASILFSFGRGLVFFAPGLLLFLDPYTRALLGTCRRAVLLILLFVAGLVLVYSRWWAWYGGLSWGPRYFVLAALPASIALAVRVADAGRSAARDAVTLAVLALSAWVGLSGAVADVNALGSCTQNNYALESLCWYTPEFSSLWRSLVQFPVVTTSVVVVTCYTLLVFAYLAAPLALALVRAARAAPSASWLYGWRL